jgi:hypothetical protein
VGVVVLFTCHHAPSFCAVSFFLSFLFFCLSVVPILAPLSVVAAAGVLSIASTVLASTSTAPLKVEGRGERVLHPSCASGWTAPSAVDALRHSLSCCDTMQDWTGQRVHCPHNVAYIRTHRVGTVYRRMCKQKPYDH